MPVTIKHIVPGTTITFTYTNPAGEISTRRIIFADFDWVQSARLFPDGAGCITGFCLDRHGIRSFDVGQVSNIKLAPTP